MHKSEKANTAHSGWPALWDVFVSFLKLGLTSFGGPIAHIAYFREAFVQRRKWLSEADFADLVAICHVMPGPSSSQVGMGLGLHRAGIRGMFAAWLAFTLPSAVLMVLFAQGVAVFGQSAGLITGLKAVAVAVVAHAVIGMVRGLSTGRRWILLAAVSLLGALLFAGAVAQLLVIIGAGLLGWWLVPTGGRDDGKRFVVRRSPLAAWFALLLFLLLLIALPILARLNTDPLLGLIDGFYRAGALVFGGGHVVLPLLEAEVVHSGLLDAETFLAGYGAAQALPGPLFSFASFLGFSASGSGGLIGAGIALMAIFLPAALIVLGVLPLWSSLPHSASIRRALNGVNAGVVGLLAAALVNPVVVQGVTSLATGLIAVVAFIALQWTRVPVWLVVLSAALVGIAVH